MGYGTITICNLYGELFKQRLKPQEVPNNRENRKYLEEVLKRGFDTILLGYGNTFLTNKFVNGEKEYLRKLLSDYKEKVVDIVDDKGEYERLTAVHPLMAGRYFPDRWRLRPFVFGKEETEKSENPGNGKPSEKAKESQKEEGENKPNEECSTNQDHEPVVSAETV